MVEKRRARDRLKNYTRLYDGVVDHPKFVALVRELGPLNALAAVGLWAKVNAYSARWPTNGRMSLDDLVELTRGLRVAMRDRLTAGLVSVGLWDRVDNETIQVHDYADWNLTSEERDALIEMKREAGRRGGRRSADARADGQPSAQADGAARAQGDLKPVRNGTNTPPTPSGADASTGTRGYPPAMFRRDCPDPGWRGQCVDAAYLAGHSDEPHPTLRDGMPKQCPHHRPARTSAGPAET